MAVSKQPIHKATKISGEMKCNHTIKGKVHTFEQPLTRSAAKHTLAPVVEEQIIE